MTTPMPISPTRASLRQLRPLLAAGLSPLQDGAAVRLPKPRQRQAHAEHLSTTLRPQAQDYESYSASLYVAPTFGCVLFDRKV